MKKNNYSNVYNLLLINMNLDEDVIVSNVVLVGQDRLQVREVTCAPVGHVRLGQAWLYLEK